MTTKCIRCGTELPLTGECARCADDGRTPPQGIPRIPELDLQLDRRTRPMPPPQLPGMPPPPPADFLKPPRTRTTPAAETLAAHDAPTRVGPLPISLPARSAPKSPPPPPRMGFAAKRSDEPLPLPDEVRNDLGLIEPGLLQPPAPTPPNAVAARTAPSIAPAVQPLTPARPEAPRPPPEALRPPAPAPSAPPVAPPARPQPVRSAAVREDAIHFRRAALWRRLLAGTVDTSALVLLSAGYLTIAAGAAGIRPGPAPSGGLDLLAHLLHAWAPVLLPGAGVALALGVAYSAIFAMLLGGRSPGRYLAGIRLVDGSGAPPGPIRSVLRAVISVGSLALLCAGFWLSLFDRRGQTLHDKLCGTFVVQPSRGTRSAGGT